MICPPTHKHDLTSTCRNAHRCQCEPCVVAKREYNFWLRNMRQAGRKPPRALDSTATRRRLQALAALGWSTTAIGAQIGVTGDCINFWHHSELVSWHTARRVSELYDRISMTVPAPVGRRAQQAVTRARNDAARKGWLPPLAWDNIDDPAEVPADAATRCLRGHLKVGANARPAVKRGARVGGEKIVCVVCSDQYAANAKGVPHDVERREAAYVLLVPGDDPDVDGVDDEVVHAALRGEGVEPTYRERRAIVRLAHAWRLGDTEISARTGIPVKSIERIRAELDLPSLTTEEMAEAA